MNGCLFTLPSVAAEEVALATVPNRNDRRALVALEVFFEIHRQQDRARTK